MRNLAAFLRAAALLLVLTLGLAAAGAAAESPDGATPAAPGSAGAATQSVDCTSGGVPTGEAAVRDTDRLVDAAIEKLGAQDLSGEEIAALKKLAAEHPELADQSGGYITNEDLLTILLVVLIIVIVL